MGWQYLVAKVTNTCDGDVAMETDPWEEKAAPDGGAVGWAGGLEVTASPRGFPSTLCTPPLSCGCSRALTLPVLCPRAWESPQEPLGSSNDF